LIFINNIIKKNFLLLISCMSLGVILSYINKNTNDLLIILYFLILSALTNPLYQEYFAPIILILVLTFFKTKITIDFKSIFILMIYLTIPLIGGLYYY